MREITVIADDRAHSCSTSGRQREHIVPGAKHSASKAASKSPEASIWTNHHLHRESQTLEGIARGERNSFQVLEKRRPLVPGRSFGAIDDVVSLKRADGHAQCVGNSQLLCQLQKILFRFQKHIFAVIDEIHLVYRGKNIAYAQQRSDEGMAARLWKDALGGIH